MLSDKDELLALTQKWFDCWRTEPDAPFNVERLRPLFHEGEVLVVDNFDDKVVVLRSFDAYAQTWNLSGFSEWRIAPVETPTVMLSVDLAVVTFVFVGRGRSLNGENRAAAQHGTHVWRKRENGWRIVHEHLTTDEATKYSMPDG